MRISRKRDSGIKRKKRFRRRKKCKFCTEKIGHIGYKRADILHRYITERGKILTRRISGNCAKHQRQIAAAVKRARFMALLPYIKE